LKAALALLPFLLACGPRWSAEHAMEPFWSRLDEDADGRVSREEYERVAYAAPPFEAVDTDLDGALSTKEVLALTLSEGPLDFKPRTRGNSLGRTPPPHVDPLRFHPGDPEQRARREALVFLREEALARDPRLLPPTREEIESAVEGASRNPRELDRVVHALFDACERARLPVNPDLATLLLRPSDTEAEASRLRPGANE
jgi:hypothetical protein